YAADMKIIPFIGESVHSIAQNDDGTWSMSFYISLFVARLTEDSTLRLDGEEIVRITYSYQLKGLIRSRENTQQFDWANCEVRSVHKKEEFTLPTQPGLLDKTTYQLALQRDLMAGKTEMSYLVLDGDEIEQYQFRVSGED